MGIYLSGSCPTVDWLCVRPAIQTELEPDEGCEHNFEGVAPVSLRRRLGERLEEDAQELRAEEEEPEEEEDTRRAEAVVFGEGVEVEGQGEGGAFQEEGVHDEAVGHHVGGGSEQDDQVGRLEDEERRAHSELCSVEECPWDLLGA